QPYPLSSMMSFLLAIALFSNPPVCWCPYPLPSSPKNKDLRNSSPGLTVQKAPDSTKPTRSWRVGQELIIALVLLCRLARNAHGCTCACTCACCAHVRLHHRNFLARLHKGCTITLVRCAVKIKREGWGALMIFLFYAGGRGGAGVIFNDRQFV